MENQDKIYEQFKKASDNIESKEFASMEKVWSRVEEKLDKKVLTKQNNLWKKIAIAASVLLVFTLTYQIFKPEPQIEIPKSEVVMEPVQTPQATPQNPIVNTETTHPEIKENAPEILKQQLQKPQPVAIQENPTKDEEMQDGLSEPESDVILKSKKAAPTISQPGRFNKGRAFDAISVRREANVASEVEKKSEAESVGSAQIIGNAQAPLVVVDGKAITGKEALSINSVSDGIAKADPTDSKEVVVLKEPLYVINGHYYTEEELFGPNPTSPYAPLNQQEIETISVLQGEKAIANFGKRGEKGVVIITTKDKKPASRQAKSEAKTSSEKAK